MKELWRVLKRDVGAQFVVSRNIGEGWRLRALRAFWCVVLLLKAVAIGLRFMCEEQLGSSVIYRGQRCTVSNWAGSRYPNLSTPGGWVEHADRNEIMNVISASELLHRFVFGFSFYTGNWHGIDVHKRMYAHLRQQQQETCS